ncbi:uncharacterized protein BJ212DRAFT_1295974 [Suillus subaureus]|uniref:Uncharacterized protein n=1 Tax=Suillus subaureus TaxID=48587 RepID=A0A9P7EMF7_9AGAM|nr:uncharacterized protein BJ212DRAFT_1295974 [Suillus subaureus]KAG1824930.1 hypothetical protein BJ212DRAFT_1295974 [Suillus subaureus]
MAKFYATVPDGGRLAPARYGFSSRAPRDESRCAGDNMLGNEGYQSANRSPKTGPLGPWCIAFATSDPYEGLPANSPLEEKYTVFRKLLKKDEPPRWYQYS